MAGPNQAAAGASASAAIAILRRQQQAFFQAAYESAEELRNEVVRTVSNASPSSPGQPPGVVTGQLRNSVFADPVAGVGSNRVTIEVGARAPYAGFLEFGTSKMAPRPFLRPAVARATPRISSKIIARVRAVLP
jgi:HK97 gp10 family phage protein